MREAGRDGIRRWKSDGEGTMSWAGIGLLVMRVYLSTYPST